MRIKRFAPLFAATLIMLLASVSLADEPNVTLDRRDGRVRVEINGDLFTEYVYEGYANPILYPIIGPEGVPMTRNYPMKEGVKGEEADHAHHRSLWFAHGNVNGVDFWATKPGHEGGRIVQTEWIKPAGESAEFASAQSGEAGKRSGSSNNAIKTRNKWVSPDGKTVLTDTRTITFRPAAEGRIIDYNITIHASEGDVTFGDTKEGTMAIRTRPELRIDQGAHATNSEGVTGKPIWGKKAAWVDYWGKVKGDQIGVAIFDHPENLRHPTTWHARHYGLIAANPFGLSYFQDKEKDAGDWTLPTGESRTFRYRFYFHKGSTKQADIEQAYQRYADSKEKNGS